MLLDSLGRGDSAVSCTSWKTLVSTLTTLTAGLGDDLEEYTAESYKREGEEESGAPAVEMFYCDLVLDKDNVSCHGDVSESDDNSSVSSGSPLTLKTLDPSILVEVRTQLKVSPYQWQVDFDDRVRPFLLAHAFHKDAQLQSSVKCDLMSDLQVVRRAFRLRCLHRLRPAAGLSSAGEAVDEAKVVRAVFALMLEHVQRVVPGLRGCVLEPGASLPLQSIFKYQTEEKSSDRDYDDGIVVESKADLIFAEAAECDPHTVVSMFTLRPPFTGLAAQEATVVKRQAIVQVIGLDQLRYPSLEAMYEGDTNSVCTCVLTDLFAISLTYQFRILGWWTETTHVMTTRAVDLSEYVDLLLLSLCKVDSHDVYRLATDCVRSLDDLDEEDSMDNSLDGYF